MSFVDMDRTELLRWYILTGVAAFLMKRVNSSLQNSDTVPEACILCNRQQRATPPVAKRSQFP